MATNETTNETNSPEAAQTWNKFANTAKKAGFREGAADGRDRVFQKSFDEGYFEGFRNGFAIAKYKGALKAESILTSRPYENDPLLEHSRRGWCQICENDLLQNTLDEIRDIQTEFSNGLLEKIHSKHKYTTKVTLRLGNFHV